MIGVPFDVPAYLKMGSATCLITPLNLRRQETWGTLTICYTYECKRCTGRGGATVRTPPPHVPPVKTQALLRRHSLTIPWLKTSFTRGESEVMPCAEPVTLMSTLGRLSPQPTWKYFSRFVTLWGLGVFADQSLLSRHTLMSCVVPEECCGSRIRSVHVIAGLLDVVGSWSSSVLPKDSNCSRCAL